MRVFRKNNHQWMCHISGNVSKISCTNCSFVCYGQTERSLKTRMTEHKRAVSMFGHDSKISCHVHVNNHEMDFGSHPLSRNTTLSPSVGYQSEGTRTELNKVLIFLGSNQPCTITVFPADCAGWWKATLKTLILTQLLVLVQTCERSTTAFSCSR